MCYELTDELPTTKDEFIIYVQKWLNNCINIGVKIYHLFMAITSPLGKRLLFTSRFMNFNITVQGKLFEFYACGCLSARTLHKKIFHKNFDPAIACTINRFAQPSMSSVLRAERALQRVLEHHFPDVTS